MTGVQTCALPIYTALLVYVDDMLIVGNNECEIAALKAHLCKNFQMKDIGVLRYFLGIEIDQTDQGIYLNQRKYALDILHETGLTDSKPAMTPCDSRDKLTLEGSRKEVDTVAYRRLVGKLIYLTITRPDICYSVQVLSQFMHSPTDDHWKAAKRVVRYVKQAPGQGILLTHQNDLQLRAYCDADWQSCAITRKSLTGFCIMLGKSLLSWRTKKQGYVATSSAESEYRAMAMTACEVTWLVRLLKDMSVSIPYVEMYCDNQSALHIARNPGVAAGAAASWGPVSGVVWCRPGTRLAGPDRGRGQGPEG